MSVRVVEGREDRMPPGEIEAHLGCLDFDPLVGRDLALGPDETGVFDDLDVVFLAVTGLRSGVMTASATPSIKTRELFPSTVSSTGTRSTADGASKVELKISKSA